MDFSKLSAPLELFGRQAQFQQIIQALARDGDLLIAGVPGSGRRTLVRRAVTEVGAKVVEIDCIRASDDRRFVQLLCEGIDRACKSPESIALVRKWIEEEKELFAIEENNKSIKLLNVEKKESLWQAFEKLIYLPQRIAVSLNKQVAIVLQGFPHIRAWDRNAQWENYLRAEIKRQTAVSYILVATIAETSHLDEDISKNLEIVYLKPLADDVVAAWAQEILQKEGLKFDPRSLALKYFLDAVKGHIGDASALIRRLCKVRTSNGIIGDREIEQTIQELLVDLATTFESLLVLLPASQAQLLESLALDPTDKPQSREYIAKHSLSRGGTLQGALLGLQHKGLIYGAEFGYRLALPLFALWLCQQIGSSD
ncbi:MAG: ATP-binding protein [Xenococcaceae cyanobacterium]